jgi:hypothetical protein
MVLVAAAGDWTPSLLAGLECRVKLCVLGLLLSAIVLHSTKRQQLQGCSWGTAVCLRLSAAAELPAMHHNSHMLKMMLGFTTALMCFEQTQLCCCCIGVSRLLLGSNPSMSLTVKLFVLILYCCNEATDMHCTCSSNIIQ